MARKFNRQQTAGIVPSMQVPSALIYLRGVAADNIVALAG